MHTNHKILLHSAKTQSPKTRMNKRKDQKPAWLLVFHFGGVAPSKSELNADSISSSEIVCVPC